jgi:hypothetical protein
MQVVRNYEILHCVTLISRPTERNMLKLPYCRSYTSFTITRIYYF